jgi:hypothetical protein
LNPPIGALGLPAASFNLRLYENLPAPDMSRQFDFNLLQSEQFVASRSILIGLPEPLARRMSSLPLTLDRAQSSIMFAAHASKQGEPWRAAAYLRASLAEFCSMEEVQETDKPSAPPTKITDSLNPLLHLLALIRHLSVHVKSVRTQLQSIPVMFGDYNFDLDIYIWTDLDSRSLSKLRNGKWYKLADLERATAWLNTAQLNWGAGDLVRAGVEEFAAQLCSHHGL